jgi:hypothetical protein
MITFQCANLQEVFNLQLTQQRLDDINPEQAESGSAIYRAQELKFSIRTFVKGR